MCDKEIVDVVEGEEPSTLHMCSGLTDVSGLVECTVLHTLELTSPPHIMCDRENDDLIEDEAPPTVHMCGGLTDVSGLAECTVLHTLELTR
tara:strand:+ start:2734 stop:3006 length:273 start_codon:yes stop_codon:yes gene_type:complete